MAVSDESVMVKSRPKRTLPKTKSSDKVCPCNDVPLSALVDHAIAVLTPGATPISKVMGSALLVVMSANSTPAKMKIRECTATDRSSLNVIFLGWSLFASDVLPSSLPSTGRQTTACNPCSIEMDADKYKACNLALLYCYRSLDFHESKDSYFRH